MKNERDVKSEVKKLLKKHGAWFFMPSMNGFGRRGIGDFIGVLNGTPFLIETKFGNNKVTKSQLSEISAFEAAGGVGFICYEDSLSDLDRWFEVFTKDQKVA